jgi:hypothetical protein
MKQSHFLAALAGAAALFVSASVSARADEGSRQHCFFASEFQNWKAADDQTLYIRIGVHRYFRLDLAGACRTAKWPDAVLITKFRGSSAVCSAIDWDLQVAQGVHSIPEACIVKQMTELTSAEADALPAKAKP